MSILKRKGDIVTSREPESRGKGKVVGKMAIPIKPGSHMYKGSDYIFDEETRSQISQEVLKERGLELYE